MIRLLVPLIFLLLSCADGPPASAEPPSSGARTEIPETIVQDQIAYTRDQTPEAPLENVPPPAQPTTPTPRPKPVPPPPPTNAAPAPPPAPAPAAASQDAPDHQLWNQLLQRYVSANGRVNYEGFRQDSAQLKKYLKLLGRAVPDDGWSRDEALAYWINAYNAFTIQLILDHWPVNSIRDIDEPWAQKFIRLEGKSYSLDQIEHQIIRPTFSEPRIHFALVCAAVSCPPLANQAYTAPRLEEMLTKATRSFINNEQFNVTQEEVVRVSPLFDWYAEDFGDVTKFLNTYLRTNIPAGKELYFLDYDWDLND
ncbi:DUF547 domain-containing protein [Lewinella sp. IMCC34183]|uniref:DUF547 domain-containing protein n=1 Tax=Lewinella sp. IMCC34183 TaxID=2248762 RepID=UPI000E272EEB|nr:DUF547 domain-containing protein [Lewinella sp. IMCC34183]